MRGSSPRSDRRPRPRLGGQPGRRPGGRAPANATVEPRVDHDGREPATGSIGRGEDDSAGESRSTPSRQRSRRSSTANPPTSPSHLGKRIVCLDVRQAVEDPRLSDGDRIRRVPIVRERRRSAGRGDGDERPPVGSGRERHRTRTEDDEASRSDVAHERPQPGPERRIVGRAADQPDVLGPDSSEARHMPRGEREPRIRERPGQRPGVRRRIRMEDEDGDAWHARESSEASSPLSALGPGIHRTRGEPRRRDSDPRVRRHRAVGPAECPPTGRLAAVRHRAGRRDRSAAVPERRRRDRRARRTGPRDRRPDAARRPQGDRAGSRPPPRDAAGVPASSTWTCSSSGVTGCR